MKHYLRFLISLLVATVWSLGGYGQVTVEQSSFTETSADNIGGDKNVSYTTAKGGAGNAPIVTKNMIRLYQKSSSSKTYGGTITIKVADGCILKSAKIGSNQKTTVAYTTGDETKLSSSSSLAANAKFSVDDLNTKSITFYCLGANNTSRLDVNYLCVTYTCPSPTITSFGASVDNKTFVIIKGNDFPKYEASATNESGEKVDGTIEYTSSNENFVTVDKTTGQTAAGTEFGEAVITATFIPTDATAYKSSSASYTINYKDAKASLAFSESSVTAVYGKESEFVDPILTLLDSKGEVVTGQTVFYNAEPAGVVVVDENTGKVTKWLKPGETKVKALIMDEGDYEGMEAEYTLVYDKAATTIEFTEGEKTVDVKKSIAVKAVVKANDAEVSDAAVTYSSSNDKIATVDDEGNVTGVADGTATITASFAGNDYYKDATSATYEVTVKNPYVTTVFYESFDNAAGTGGNDDKWSQSIALDDWVDSKLDNQGWTYSGAKYFANKCVRIGKTGSITTPALSKLSGNATLTFNAGSWSGDNTTLTLSITGGGSLDKTSISLSNASFTNYTVNITDGTPNSKIKFAVTASKRFFLDEVKITQSLVALDEEKDNSEAISDNENETMDVKMNRTISSDYLNPVCFPFALTETQIADAFGEGSEVYTFDDDVKDGKLSFSPVSTMEAGKPYIVKASKSATTIALQNVTFSKMSEDESEAMDENTDIYTLKGAYSPYSFTTADGTELFLGKDNALHMPQQAGQQMKGLRAYFTVPSGVKSQALKVVVNGQTTSISSLMDGKTMTGNVYNLNGQYVGKDLGRLAKGVYVMNGKKYVVK